MQPSESDNRAPQIPVALGFRGPQAPESKPRAAGNGNDYMQQIATSYIEHVRKLPWDPATLPPVHAEIHAAILLLYAEDQREAAVRLWEQRDERSIELLTAVLYHDPRIALTIVQKRYADYPAFLVHLKEEANRLRFAKPTKLPWKPDYRKHDFRKEVGKVVRQYSEGEFQEKDLLANPAFVYHLARATGTAVPFSLVLHFELNEIERSRKLRLQPDSDAVGASLRSMAEDLDLQMRISSSVPANQRASATVDTPEASQPSSPEAGGAVDAAPSSAKTAERQRAQSRLAEIKRLLQLFPSSPTAPSAQPPAAPPSRAETPENIVFPPHRAMNADLVGLAFSGGGIRSATFNLGILQALAELDVLRFVDYLSAVSGGSYIASWLAAWSKRQKDGIRRVQRWLAPFRSPDPCAREVSPIWFLRRYSNYLTPLVSMFSADTWTAVAIWIRNTLLNMVVLLLFLTTLLIVPHWVLAVVQCNRGESLLAVAAAIMVAASVLIGTSLAKFERGPDGKLRRGASFPALTTQKGIQWTIILPLMAAAWIGSMCIEPMMGTAAFPRERVMFASALVLWLALGIAQLSGRFQRCFYDRDVSAKRWEFSLWAGIAIAACGLFAAATGGLFAGKLAGWMAGWLPASAPLLVTAGPSFLLIGLAAVVTVYIGLLGVNFPDERREWWARLAAWLIIYSLAWAALFGVSLFGHILIQAVTERTASAWHNWLREMGGVAAALAWVASTIWGLVVGYSSKTPASGPPTSGKMMKLAGTVAPYVFIAGLLLILSYATGELLQCLVHKTAFWFLVCIVAGAALTLLAAWRIDVNEFSMHHFYRNRLIRAYLGASHEDRVPNPFTGFDRTDDIPVAGLQTQAVNLAGATDPYLGPYLLINTTMNVVKGKELAFQERKAESFAFGPLYSGSEYVGAASGNRRNLEPFGYRPTGTYAFRGDGIGLGTTMAISGAAVNPNMGYHSSPPLAFLMTLFDVRLGWWLGNPRHRRTWLRHSPRVGLLYLLTELMGAARATSAYINLSDGGHFENLGIYELVRRRCRFIIACDAEEDSKFGFEGLGNAVRKCRTDFNVDITIPLGELRPVVLANGSRAHCSVGQIKYPGPVPDYGVLLYIKASLTNDEPADVREYQWHNPDFPHQTTMDQWFGESQFESYRALGYHIGKKTFDFPPGVFQLPENRRIREIFAHLQTLWAPHKDSENQVH